jgi:hypothetical protein
MSKSTETSFTESENRQLVILNNIKELQKKETDLYNKMEASYASSTGTIDEQELLVNKINELSTMRMTMFGDLESILNNTHGSVAQTRIDLVDELTTVGVMETELNNIKSNLNYLTTNKDNKMRMVEINTYYASKYKAQSGLMKLVIMFCIPLLILAILSKKNIIPQQISNGLIGIIIVIGSYMVIKQYIDLTSRSNMNYDEFDWKWDPDSADVGNNNIGNKNMGLGSGCIGSACCTTGMYYDSDLGKCQSGETPIDPSLEGFTSGRASVTFVEVPKTPCPFKQTNTVVKPYSEDTYNFVKVSAR